MARRSTTLPARPVAQNIVALDTRDQALRESIDQFVATHRFHLTEREYQFRASKLLGRVECTDSGNSIRFAARFGHMCKYVPEPDKWYVWNGTVWAVDDTGIAMQYAKKCAAYIEQEADLLPRPVNASGEPLMYPEINVMVGPTPEQYIILDKFQQYEEEVKKMKAWGKTSRSKRGLEALLQLAKDECGMTIRKESFDADDMCINLLNGTFDLRTKQLRPHDRNDLITLQANVRHDSSASCPNWDKFIDKITNHRPTLARFLCQLAGMGLTGERVEDIFVVFYGDGSNGKTVFQEVVREMLGGYAGVATPNMFMERKGEGGDFENVGLKGVRMLFKDETKQGKQLDESMVKAMTGGSPIRACHKFKDYFEFLPKFTPILSTNHRPRIMGNDNGIWRRLKEVPFDWNFDFDPERRPKEDVLSELRAEAAGIFNWCLAGFYDYKQQGVFIAPEIQMATSAYRELSDVIGGFIGEDCMVGKEFDCGKGILYTAYSKYMEDNGSHALNKPNFGEELRKRGFMDGKTGQKGHFWRGIRLRDKESEDMQIKEDCRNEDVSTSQQTLQNDVSMSHSIQETEDF